MLKTKAKELHDQYQALLDTGMPKIEMFSNDMDSGESIQWGFFGVTATVSVETSDVAPIVDAAAMEWFMAGTPETACRQIIIQESHVEVWREIPNSNRERFYQGRNIRETILKAVADNQR